jgi:hypothetical protein
MISFPQTAKFEQCIVWFQPFPIYGWWRTSCWITGLFGLKPHLAKPQVRHATPSHSSVWFFASLVVCHNLLAPVIHRNSCQVLPINQTDPTITGYPSSSSRRMKM